MSSDVEALERAIVGAVAPAEVTELHGWIVAFDGGTVSRARSAAPLSHATADASAVAPIRDAYAVRSLTPMFRVPIAPGFAAVEEALAASAMEAQQPTDVQVARAADVARVDPSAQVRIDTRPDAAWTSIFLGEGFDPVDGASRVRLLTRAPGSLFASIRGAGGDAIAAGVLSFGSGWAGIHGMRTALTHRRQGLASRVLAALAQAALDRGFGRVALQVERANEPAQELYARCGFERAWTYHYWREKKKAPQGGA